MNNEIVITNHNPQDITIREQDNQTIFVNGGGDVIGITDVRVNGSSVVSNNIAYVLVPVKTSQLTNDGENGINPYLSTETDPTVPSYVKTITRADINSWNNKQDSLVSGSNIKTINNTSLLGSGNINVGGADYSAGTGISIDSENVISNTITSYEDLTDLPTIPTKTSDLTNDSDFVSEDELAEVALTGSYNSLSDTPVIPSATSELTNDSNFVNTTDLSTALSTKQDTLVSGTNIKTINNNSILGSGNLTITGGSATDVQINGTSITSGGVANIITESAYNSSTNKIATKSDIPTNTSQLTNNSNFAVTNANNNFSTDQTINGDTIINGPGNLTKNRTMEVNSSNGGTITLKNTNSNVSIGVGVGGSGYNRGIYDDVINNWMISRDSNNTTVINGGGTNNEIDLNGNIKGNFSFESGTFTPSIAGSTTAGTTTYSNQYGIYYKIGKLVFYDFKIAVTSTSNGSGLIRIEGLPYINNLNTSASNIGNLMITGPLSTNTLKNLWGAGNDIIISTNNLGIGGTSYIDTTDTTYIYGHGFYFLS